MILDNILLSGTQAYLADSTGNTNLAGSATVTATTPPIGPGMVMEIGGINLLIESGQLPDLFSLQSASLFSVGVVKEMYPGLFKDPYTHRVHTIGGYDDFSRGTFQNIKVIEVDGYPTLVSTGTKVCKWISEIYSFATPFTIDCSAWDLATSKLTPADGFHYGFKLNVWYAGSNLHGHPSHTIVLTPHQGFTPVHPRLADHITGAHDVIAYQIEFDATVNYDTYLREIQTGLNNTDDIGRPLLRSFCLLEAVTPANEFLSLNEVLNRSATYYIFEEYDAPAKRLTATIPVPAALEQGESLNISVSGGVFTRLEARLAASVKLKPPVLDKKN